MRKPKPIHLCRFFEKLGLPIPRYFVGWSNTGGGDHGGADWIISSNTEVAGNHTNIGLFKVNSGITTTVKAYDGASYGTFEVHAKNVNVIGTITATGKGYGGGGGGGGGGGRQRWAGAYCDQGSGGAGTLGGSNGSPGTESARGSYGGTGGAGGGTYGGIGGTAGSRGNYDVPVNGGPGGAGGHGGYAVAGGQGDTSIDELLNLGGGGAGAGGGGGGDGGHSTHNASGGGGGGAGNKGAGWIKLYAAIYLEISGNLYAKGLDNLTGNGGSAGTASVPSCTPGANGGAASVGGGSNGGSGGGGVTTGNAGGAGEEGGYGAGGGILLWCNSKYGIVFSGTIDNRGGGNSTTNGGTIKILTLKGCQPSVTGMSYGRLYQGETLIKGILIP